MYIIESRLKADHPTAHVWRPIPFYIPALLDVALRDLAWVSEAALSFEYRLTPVFEDNPYNVFAVDGNSHGAETNVEGGR